MGNKTSAKAHQLAVLLTGRRFCSHCQLERQAEGGLWRSKPGGGSRRWKCGHCLQAAKERAHKTD